MLNYSLISEMTQLRRVRYEKSESATHTLSIANIIATGWVTQDWIPPEAWFSQWILIPGLCLEYPRIHKTMNKTEKWGVDRGALSDSSRVRRINEYLTRIFKKGFSRTLFARFSNGLYLTERVNFSYLEHAALHALKIPNSSSKGILKSFVKLKERIWINTGDSVQEEMNEGRIGGWLNIYVYNH